MPHRTQMPTGHAFFLDLNARDDQHDVRLAPREVGDLRRSSRRRSGVRAVVDLRAVVDVEDVDGAIGLVDPVDHPVRAAAGWPRGRPGRTPARQRRLSREAVVRSRAGRLAGTGSCKASARAASNATRPALLLWPRYAVRPAPLCG
jgi:hypothetical protein